MKHLRCLALLLAAIMLLPLCAAWAEDHTYEELILPPAVEQPEAEEAVPMEEIPGFVWEPSIPETVEKTIFGADDRKVISNPKNWPYAPIAYLHVDMACGCSWSGTGFMVAYDCMMTNAHMLVCYIHNKPMTKMAMYFGFTSYKNYLYKYETTSDPFWYNAKFFTGNGGVKPGYDYGYMRVPKSVGQKTGHFGLKPMSDQDLKATWMELAGYRDDVLRSGKGYPTGCTSTEVWYKMDAQPGNSGSPVFDADGYVLAVHSAEDSNKNYGCRITWDIINEMKSHGFFQ